MSTWRGLPCHLELQRLGEPQPNTGGAVIIEVIFGLGFTVYGSGFRVQGLGFIVMAHRILL